MISDILKSTNHREHLLPTGPWMMMQKWEHLLFINWPVPIENMKGILPPGLELDIYDGRAWISAIPFHVSKMRLRNFPPIPFLNSYLELNVRTYVKRKGVAGVYFFSMDVNSLLTVFGARLATLPYHYSEMNMRNQQDTYHFLSSREKNEHVRFKVSYRPVGKVFNPTKESLAYWLLERYFMWSYIHGHLYRGELHHKPWQVHIAEVKIEEKVLQNQIDKLHEGEAVFFYSREKVALSWRIRKEE